MENPECTQDNCGYEKTPSSFITEPLRGRTKLGRFRVVVGKRDELVEAEQEKGHAVALLILRGTSNCTLEILQA